MHWAGIRLGEGGGARTFLTPVLGVWLGNFYPGELEEHGLCPGTNGGRGFLFSKEILGIVLLTNWLKSSPGIGGQRLLLEKKMGGMSVTFLQDLIWGRGQ